MNACDMIRRCQERQEKMADEYMPIISPRGSEVIDAGEYIEQSDRGRDDRIPIGCEDVG
jgi:hypothetical protein